MRWSVLAACLITGAVACTRPNQMVPQGTWQKRSVAITAGASMEARKALASEVANEVNRKRYANIRQRVPSVSDTALARLQVSWGFKTEQRVGREPTTTDIAVECEFPKDGRVGDAAENEILDACQAEVQATLSARLGRGPGL